MTNVVMITARSGKQQLANKNMRLVAGKPLVSYPIAAGLAAKTIDRVFVTTNGADLAAFATGCGAEVIERPQSISGPDSPHYQTIEHGTDYLANLIPDLGIVVILMGNTAMIDGPTIDACVTRLEGDDSLSGVLTVWQAQDDHPYRALVDGGDGCLVPAPGPREYKTANRQAYPPTYYFDHGVFAVRWQFVKDRTGVNPWTWMGPRTGYVVRQWDCGRDVHDERGLDLAEWWVARTKRLGITSLE